MTPLKKKKKRIGGPVCFSLVSRSQCFHADLSQLSLRAAGGPIINTLDLWISRGGAGEKCQGCACLVPQAGKQTGSARGPLKGRIIAVSTLFGEMDVCCENMAK